MKRRLSFIIFMLFSCFFAISVTKAEMVSEEDLGSIDPAKRYMLEKTAEATRVANAQINSVSVRGSIATITSTGGVAAYYVGTTNSPSASTTYSASSTSNTYYVGVKNGTYYFWVSGYGNNLGTVPYQNNPVRVTGSCTTEYKTNVKEDVQYVQSCFESIDGGKFVAHGNSNQDLVQCASGYVIDQASFRVVEDTCSNTSTKYQGQQLRRAYCKKVFAVRCVPKGGVVNPVDLPSLASLEVSNGTLSPAFNASQKTYKVNVSADTTTITLSATPANGSSFVNNYGPRSYNLSYGLNRLYIKVSNASGNIETYTINVTRADNRSNVNSLSSLTISQGELSPGFSADNTTYNVVVPNNVTSIAIGAVLSDSKSYFDEGFGPRTVQLNEGLNNILVKVRSQAGSLRAYTINVTRQTANETVCSTEPETKALLSRIEFIDGPDGELIDKVDIKKDVFTYEIEVPFEVANLTINAFPVTEGDTFEVQGIKDLVVDEPQEATIVVSSATCPGLTKTYTLSIKRTSHSRFSKDARLTGLQIDGHKEFKFEEEKHDYELTLKKKEKDLKITYSVVENATCTLEGNANLGNGSKVVITCVAEDNETTEVYTITTKAPKKGAPVFLIILVVIIVILVLVYLVMRLLGYRIYFNFSAITAMFREMKEKRKNK